MPKQIMVSTKYEGIFAGTVPTNQDMGASTITLTECRMADDWGHKDVHRLADIGPGPNASISKPATVTLQGVTAVWEVPAASWTKWEAGTWRPNAGQ